MSDTVNYKIKLTDDFSKSLNNIQSRFKKFDSMIKSAGTLFGAYFSVQALSGSVKAWGLQEQAIASVQATLKSTGGASGKTLDELIKKSEQFQESGVFGDDTVLQGVTAQLLTFANVSGKTFDRAQSAIQDVTAKLYGAEAGSEALRSTSIQIGKALNDPITGMSMLGRSGIQFSAKQKEVIKSLAETNRLGEAQSLMLDEIEKQYGGTNAALAKTATGGMKQTANMLGDLNEAVGQNVTRLISKYNPALQKTIKNLTKFISVSPVKQLKEEQDKVNKLAITLSSNSLPQEQRLKIYRELKELSPKVAAGFDSEGKAIGNLTEIMKLYNEEAAQKILFATLDADKVKAMSEATAANSNILKQRIRILDGLSKVSPDVAFNKNLTDEEKISRYVTYLQKVVEFQKKSNQAGTVRVVGGITTDTRTKEQKELEAVGFYLKEINNQQSKYNKNLKIATDAEEEMAKVRKLLGLDKTASINTTLTGQGIDALSQITSAAPKIFNINITKLVETFNVSSTTIKEGSIDVKKIVTQALAEAINDTQLMAR